ncbi:MAG: FtsW/RodA/SpoVE family cell cycle protein [Victivallales bacterium]|nr:FtsW/RodA/SpoVE family cell cycle protein [Victivallales bacterium]
MARLKHLHSPSRILAVVVLAALSAIGVGYIFSTGYLGSAYPIRPNWYRQCVFLAFGAGVCWGMARLDNRRLPWRTLVWSGYALSMLLLVAVLLFGKEIGGARRWLTVGPLLLQPAEFAKVFTILAGSLIFSGELFRKRWQELVAGLCCFGLPVLLILCEPSYGNAGALAPCLLVLAGIRWLPRWLWKLGMLAALIILFGTAYMIYQLRSRPSEPPVPGQVQAGEGGFLHGYHLRRLQAFLSPEGDWNEQQSLMTVAGGGWFGKGYLNGTMKKLGFLPRTVAPTDFIFAVIAEEGGLLFGVLPVLFLYGLLLGLLLHWGANATCPMDLNLVASGSTLLFVHILVGVGMSIRLVPVIGLPLPLLSYGGSFTVATMLLLGALFGTHQQTEEDAAADMDKDEGNPVASKPAETTWRLGSFFKLRIRSRDE